MSILYFSNLHIFKELLKQFLVITKYILLRREKSKLNKIKIFIIYE